MRQVLIRALALLKRPGVLLLVLALAGGGSALVSLPLFGLPGYELSLALSVAVGLLGGGIGIASAFQERRLIQGRDPRPKEALRQDSALASAYLAVASAVFLNGMVLVPPFLVSTAYALTSTACDPFSLAGFYPVLALPSAVLAAAAGVFCGFLFRGLGSAVGFYLGLVAVSLAVTAWPVVFGPQVFAYNHFLGFVPGPLYDEALELRPRLAWFRLETLLIAAFLWLLVAFFLDMREGRIRRPHFRPGAFLLLGAVAASIGALEQRASALGLRMTDRALKERLGGTRESEHFELIYPRGKEKAELDRWIRDLEFRHHQLTAFLGSSPGRRIRVWLHRSESDKELLVGAGRTQFAKPWRRELHLNDRPFPHATLKHELAHVLAASAGSGPFDVTTRLGVWPLMGIIEGVAVAADSPLQGELTLHQWAAGMRKQGLAPDVRTLVGPQGFYQAAPARAYTLAGSFLRHLAETYGPEKLRALYAHGDFQGAYGRSLDALTTEWEAMLDAVPLDEDAVSRAFARFRTGSLFTRACAREVAGLREKAEAVLASDPEQALGLYRRSAALQPDEPAFTLGEARALEQLDREEEASQVLSRLSGRLKDHPALSAEVALAQADVASEVGKTQEAREHLGRVLSLAPSPEQTRTAQVKLAALESPTRAGPIRAYFRAGQEDLRLLKLSLALEEAPADPYLHYLLGRRLHQAGAPRLALEHLLAPALAELPEAIRREALRLRVEAAYLAGDCGAVRHEVGALPDFGLAFRTAADEWRERCDFEDRAFAGELVPDEGIR